MQRRKYMATVAAAGTAAVAGCGFIGGSDDRPETPKEVAEGFIAALDNGDHDDASELLPPGITIKDSHSSSELEQWEELEISIDGSETIEESDTEAVVEVIFSYTGSNEEETWVFELVNEDEEWFISDVNEG